MSARDEFFTPQTQLDRGFLSHGETWLGTRSNNVAQELQGTPPILKLEPLRAQIDGAVTWYVPSLPGESTSRQTMSKTNEMLLYQDLTTQS